jgi:hypothetical protein
MSEWVPWRVCWWQALWDGFPVASTCAWPTTPPHHLLHQALNAKGSSGALIALVVVMLHEGHLHMHTDLSLAPASRC